MTNRNELVTGHEKHKHYHDRDHDDEGRREGRSIFYTNATASQLSKSAVELETDLYKKLNFPAPYSSPPAVQRRNDRAEIVLLSSLEASRASVTSADVQMIEGEQNTSVQGSLQVCKLSIESYIVAYYYIKCDWQLHI